MRYTGLNPPKNKENAFVKSKEYFRKVYSIDDIRMLNKLSETYSIHLRQGKEPKECEKIALIESDYIINNTVIDIAEDVTEEELDDDIIDQNISKFDRDTIEELESEYESIKNENISDDGDLMQEILSRMQKRTNKQKLKKQIIENARYKRGQDITEEEATEMVDVIMNRKATDIARQIERKINTIDELDKKKAEEGLVDFGIAWGYKPYVKLTDRSKKIIKDGIVNMVTENMEGWSINPSFEGWSK